MLTSASILPELLFFFSNVASDIEDEVHNVKGNLVDACIPGDVVTVTGIIRVINNYMDIGGGMIKRFL